MVFAHSPVAMPKTPRDARIIVLTYVVAIAAGLGLAAVMPAAWPSWATVLAADVGATVLVFIVSRAFDNTSVYDPYWSVAPVVIAAALLATTAVGSSARGILVFVLTLTWGARLTYSWWRGWRGMGHEDWRYVDLRRTMGRAYWPSSFLGLHVFPTLLVYTGCLGLLAVMQPSASSFGWLDVVGAATMGAAVWIEATADRQLHDFVGCKPSPDAVLTTGLWGRCRHPNYLGEVMLWYGLAAFGLAADPTAWWVLLGPAVMTGLFVGISIPMIERRMLRKRPGYADVVARYPRLLPLGPRRR